MHRPNYELPPVVQYKDLLADATGTVPRARQMHTLVCADSRTLICYGGFCANIDTNDLSLEALPRDSAGLVAHASKYSIQENRWSTLFGPSGVQPIPSRALHTSVIHGQHMYVFGVHHKKENSVHRLDIQSGSWETFASDDAPPALIGHTAVVVGDGMWIYGGESANGVSPQLHAFDFNKRSWRHVTHHAATPLVTADLPRRDHSAVIFQSTMIVYGGASPACDSLGLLKFDAATCTWSHPPSVGVDESRPRPHPRRGHSCQLHQHYMLVFGGAFRSKLMDDFWVYNIMYDTWTSVQLTEQTPPMRRAFASSCIAGVFWYIHGGGNERCLLRSLLRLDVNEIARQVDDTFTIPDHRWSEKEFGKREEARIRRAVEVVAMSSQSREASTAVMNTYLPLMTKLAAHEIWAQILSL